MQTDRALIIAAGRGSRFGAATLPCPKPLIEVAGVPLLGRTILSAYQAGIRHFTIVTGYLREDLENYAAQNCFAASRIRCLFNEQWHRPNGFSVLRAKGEVDPPFVLLMADHLFDAAILKKISAESLPPGACRLAIDKHIENVPDLDDATKVVTHNGLVRNIGKTIQNYDAIDTGIFLCSDAIFPALEKSIAAGREGLSDGIRVLADQDKMEAMEIGGLFWQDVDDEKGLKEAEIKVKSLKFKV